MRGGGMSALQTVCCCGGGGGGVDCDVKIWQGRNDGFTKKMPAPPPPSLQLINNDWPLTEYMCINILISLISGID